MTTRDLIKQKMSEHTAAGNFICAQSLLGAGGVANTVSLEDKKGLIDLPISDSSNPGVCVGMALAGKRPVYIIRYGGFSTINYWPILQFAAKSKEMWDFDCDIFVRLLCSEGSIGPVASGFFAASAMHFSGVKVFAPMSSNEWISVWNEFQTGHGPIICAEFRQSYDIDYEFENILDSDAEVNIICVALARIEAVKAKEMLEKEGITTNIIHLFKLKPLEIKSEILPFLENKINLIVESGYETCGVAEHISYKLIEKGIKSKILGIEDKVAGFSPLRDNLTPNHKKIIHMIKHER